MKILDKILKNDGDNGFDHSYIPINTSYTNTNFFLTLLAFTLNLTLTLDQSLTLVSNAISLQNTQHQVPIKLFPRFEYTT